MSATDSIVLASSPFCDVGGTLDAGMARFFPVSGTVNVEVPAIPLEYALHQNYPNPFNSMTHINFSVKAAGRVKLEVYNLLGQCVKTLLNEEMNAGKHEVSFEAKSLASGPYFYRLFINKFVSVKKMLLLK